MTRAIVIGGGHNGLVCAAELAAAGVDVTVLERGPQVGGGVSSAELTRPGFVHDSCAAFMPVAHASPAMAEQSLEAHGVEWVNPEAIAAHPFLDGEAIVLHRSVERTAQSLERVASGSGDAWQRLLAQVLPLWRPFAGAVFHRLPPVVDPLRLAAGLRGETVELARRLLGSAASFGLDLFGQERPTAWLAGSSMHSGLEPRAAGSGAFAFLLQLLGHAVGWPFPRGGAGRVAQALAARAGDLGAGLRCDAEVERIVLRNGRVAGVELSTGEEVAADAVVATVTAGPLAGMLPREAVPERVFRRLTRFRPGLGVFKLDLALERPVPWASEAARGAAVVHLAGELSDLSRSAQEGNRGQVPERPAMVVGQQSLFDDTRAPPGGHTLYAYTHVPARSELSDEQIAGRMEAQLERFAPGFSGCVLARHTRSPAQLESENPSMVGGDLAGGSFELDQQLVFRPMPELSRYRAPLRGLYVGSASVHPGGATHGVPGREAARMLLRDRAGLRPWRRLRT